MIILNLKIYTKSNLYIGGMPQEFEIGGIDMTTVTRDGRPYIPASSFKGALREICKDHENDDIAELYEEYSDQEGKIKQKHLFIFGVPGRNRTAKLVFNDFICTACAKDVKGGLFSIDMKNSIEEDTSKLISNPRTYKVAKAGLTFEGKILFRLIDMPLENQNLIRKYVVNMCAKFNDGLYRLGNSKSRGYGHIQVTVEEG